MHTAERLRNPGLRTLVQGFTSITSNAGGRSNDSRLPAGCKQISTAENGVELARQRGGAALRFPGDAVRSRAEAEALVGDVERGQHRHLERVHGARALADLAHLSVDVRGELLHVARVGARVQGV